MKTADEYIESLRDLRTEVYFMGERAENLVDHPAFRSHINSPRQGLFGISIDEDTPIGVIDYRDLLAHQSALRHGYHN